MITIEEMDSRWKEIRSDLGNMISWVDGKMEHLKSWNKAYDRGHADGYELGLDEGVKQGAELAAMHGSDGSEDAWAQGVDFGVHAVWETVKAWSSEMSYDEVVECFGESSACDNSAFFSIQPDARVRQFRDYQAKKKAKESKICPGDEVEAWDSIGDTGKWIRFIAWNDECGLVTGIDEYGGHYTYPTSECKKTGRHFTVSFTKKEENDEKN